MTRQKLILLMLLIVGLTSYLLGPIVGDDVAERHIADQQECIDVLKYYIDNHIPTFVELQEMVGAEPDGIIGPNTIEKWERKICDQYVVESINRMTKGDKK